LPFGQQLLLLPRRLVEGLSGVGPLPAQLGDFRMETVLLQAFLGIGMRAGTAFAIDLFLGGTLKAQSPLFELALLLGELLGFAIELVGPPVQLSGSLIQLELELVGPKPALPALILEIGKVLVERLLASLEVGALAIELLRKAGHVP
jgi:hypothetical protein